MLRNSYCQLNILDDVEFLFSVQILGGQSQAISNLQGLMLAFEGDGVISHRLDYVWA